MRFIAHRGNVKGPKPEWENKKSYIRQALQLGFDVEIDVSYIDGKLFLGHDEPGEEVSLEYLSSSSLWVHAKTAATFAYLTGFSEINTFLQSEEAIVVSSRQYLWNHSKCTDFTPRSVAVVLDYDKEFLSKYVKISGVCSDYVLSYRMEFEQDSYSGELFVKRNPYPFDLLVLDIDGVMTDGTKTYNTAGNVVSKKYADVDFTAIKRFKDVGVQVCFLSGDTRVNKEMAQNRKIPFYHSKGVDKANFIPVLCREFNVTKDRIAYVGDDFYDLSIIRQLEQTFCPSSAASCVKAEVSYVIQRTGGTGVVEDLFSRWENHA